MVLDHCFGELFGVVGDAAQGQCGVVLDGDGGVEQEGAQLLHDSQLVEVVDVLWLRGEVGYLLRKLDLCFLELFKGCLQSTHKVTKI